jgi:flagellar hook protein FlgE
MSILRTMYTGVSGLNAEGDALGVVGDNIANSNTVGFKGQRAIFEDMLGRSMSETGAGAGVRMSEIQQMFNQGALTNTGVSTDMSISGDGFFVVSGSVNGTKGNFYSRAGQFSIDAKGSVVNPAGLALQGYPANKDGSFSPNVAGVSVPTSSLAPSPSTKMSVVANLDASAVPPAAPWNVASPTSTSNFSTAMTVSDSLGKSHNVSLYFEKTATAGQWNYHAVVDGGDLTGGVAGTNVEIGSGSMQFGTNGSLTSVTTATPIAANFVNAAPAQAISLNFGSSTGAGGSGTDGMTQYAAPSSVASQTADGYAAGDLVGVNIDGQGIVRGNYSNGQKIALAQIALAKFNSNEGLARAGQDLWTETQNSGSAALGGAGVGGRGSVTAGTLEQSNVDIATQFVDLIAHQRAFQADSKTITTADEMMQDLVNLKH